MTSLPFNSGVSSTDKSFDVCGTRDIEAPFETSEECQSVEIIDDKTKQFRFTNSEAGTEFEDESAIDPDCSQLEFILQVLEERIRWSQKKKGESEEFTRSGWRGRKLFLTLSADQVAQETGIEDIRSRFQMFNYTVKILKSDRPDSFVILFPGRTTAQKALVEMNAIGFKLVKKRPPRPSPSFPVMFRALSSLKIRRGKALSAEIIGQVKQGDDVMVNQVKGRRARLMSVQNGENRGWVSVHTETGRQLLERLDPSETKLCFNDPER